MHALADLPIDTELKARLYIDGQWVEPAGGERLEVVNPATEAVFHTVPAAGAEDIEHELPIGGGRRRG